MDPSKALQLQPEPSLPGRPEWVRAGLGGFACAAPLATSGALGSYLLLDLGSSLFSHPLALLLFVLAVPVAMSLPVAFATSRLARRASRSSPEEGAALVAGAGVATALVAAGTFLVLADSVVALGMMAPVLLSAAVGIGLVGAAGFLELPQDAPWYRREVPSLYVGLIASGLSAAHLLFWASATWITLSFLMPSFLGELVRNHPSEAFAYFSSAALALGMLAPVSFSSARSLARVRQGIPLPVLAGFVAAPLLVPTSMALAGAWFLYSNHFAFLYPSWAASAGGFALGSLPHLLAIHLGGTLGRRERAPAALEAGPEAGAVRPRLTASGA